MNTKLTLSLNKDVIEKAKRYAKNEGQSLSAMVENYLSTLIEKEEADIGITPLVESLSGSLKIDEEFDYKKELTDILTAKYEKHTH